MRAKKTICLQIHHSEEDIKSFVSDCKKVSKQGYCKGDSAYVHGVTDICFTIVGNAQAVATLTPFHLFNIYLKLLLLKQLLNTYVMQQKN